MAVKNWRRVVVDSMSGDISKAKIAGVIEFRFLPREDSPDEDNDRKLFRGYVFERHANGWWISPDTWVQRQDKNIGPYESMEDAYAALEIMVRLNAAPIFGE